MMHRIRGRHSSWKRTTSRIYQKW